MNHSHVDGIGRVTYAIRLGAGLLIAILLYGLTVVALLRDASILSGWLFGPLLVATIVANGIGVPYGLAKYVFIPRLKNAGFVGPLMWLMVVLCIFPATFVFAAIALLFLPSRFVKEVPPPRADSSRDIDAQPSLPPP